MLIITGGVSISVKLVRKLFKELSKNIEGKLTLIAGLKLEVSFARDGQVCVALLWMTRGIKNIRNSLFRKGNDF